MSKTAFAAFFLVIAANLGFGSSLAWSDVVKIGLLAPMTGPNAGDGQDFVRGVELAVKEANAGGGVAGHTFEVVVADTKDASAAAVTSAGERLLGTEGVHVILTGYASLSMFEVELMADAGMPYLAAGPSPQFAAIVGRDPGAYDCCWSFTADFKGYETDVTPAVEALSAAGTFDLKDRTVAIISSDNPYSRTISEGMKVAFADAGWTITVDELVPFGPVSDWRPILAKVREAPPELIVNTDFLPANAALFVNQFQENPTDSVMFLQYAPLVPEFVKLTGENSTGVLYNAIGAPLVSENWPRGVEITNRYEAEYREVSAGPYGTVLYEMAIQYFQALEKVGDPADHDAIGRALGSISRPIAAGLLAFDPDTHVAIQSPDHIPVTFFQIQEGGVGVMVAPEAYKTGDFQRPPWMSE